MKIQHLPLSGLKLITRNIIEDHRGSLQRVYCSNILNDIGIKDPIAQINLTATHFAGTVRGMHFQYPPYSEIKIVSCLKGKIFDVVIDLREKSPTFLKWHGEILSSHLRHSLLIPKGFAHGFQALTNDCELLYFHTVSYRSDAEGGVSPVDPMVDIKWPLVIKDMSERDRHHVFLTPHFSGLLNEM